MNEASTGVRTADRIAQIVAELAGVLLRDAHVAHRVQHLNFGRALVVEAARELLVGEPVALAHVRHRRPLARALLQDEREQSGQLGGHVLGHLVDAAQDLLLDGARGVRVERQLADQHVVEEDAERPDVDVHAVVEALAAQQLRRRVKDRAAESGELLRRRGAQAEAEVADLHDVLRREEDVLGAQVAMDDILRVLRDTHTHSIQTNYSYCIHVLYSAHCIVLSRHITSPITEQIYSTLHSTLHCEEGVQVNKRPVGAHIKRHIECTSKFKSTNLQVTCNLSRRI